MFSMFIKTKKCHVILSILEVVEQVWKYKFKKKTKTKINSRHDNKGEISVGYKLF